MLDTYLATQIQQCIAKPGFHVAKPGFRVAKPGFRVAKPGFRVAKTWISYNKTGFCVANCDGNQVNYALYTDVEFG